LTVLAAEFFFFALKYRRWKRKEIEEAQNKKEGNRKEKKSNLRPFRLMICPFLFYSSLFRQCLVQEPPEDVSLNHTSLSTSSVAQVQQKSRP
jgi:hypothetical protein